MSGRFAPRPAGREALWTDRVIARRKMVRSQRATRWVGWRRIPHACMLLKIQVMDLGIKDCWSARRSLSNRTCVVDPSLGRKSRYQNVILLFLTSQSTAKFAPVTWSSCDLTTNILLGK